MGQTDEQHREEGADHDKGDGVVPSPWSSRTRCSLDAIMKLLSKFLLVMKCGNKLLGSMWS